MKEKLTLTIDGDTIARAKAFAKKEKTSLSQLVEQQFNRLGGKSFTEKWRGQFKLPKPDPDDPRLNYLLQKYVKSDG
ncbi:MAG: hypothetical protein H0W20_13060 [Chthoniobacterales bacterium]|nr:hypothetical protein [Chthoniobacterales bacterium]